MSDKPRLYSYFRSSCSWRVRIALNLAGLEVEQVHIHLVKNGGEQHSQDYKKLNPLGQVPTLEMDGLLLTQSVAIMEYIHDTHPEAHILPEDPAMKAKVRMITEMICSGIQPIQNLSVMQKHSQDQAERMAWSKYWITAGFRALEAVLQKTAGECCVGDTVTMADCCIVPQVFNAARFSVDMSEFPMIEKLNENLSSRPEFMAAHPTQQPDCPTELK
jgi:maleylacetoacetate isomerase